MHLPSRKQLLPSCVTNGHENKRFKKTLSGFFVINTLFFTPIAHWFGRRFVATFYRSFDLSDEDCDSVPTAGTDTDFAALHVASFGASVKISSVSLSSGVLVRASKSRY